MALCQGQGGATASTAEEWKQSWTAALYAAEHGLLLLDVEPYEVSARYYIHIIHLSRLLF